MSASENLREHKYATEVTLLPLVPPPPNRVTQVYRAFFSVSSEKRHGKAAKMVVMNVQAARELIVKTLSEHGRRMTYQALKAEVTAKGLDPRHLARLVWGMTSGGNLSRRGSLVFLERFLPYWQIEPGDRFGKLVAVEPGHDYLHPSGVRETQWLFRCECGESVLLKPATARGAANSGWCSCRTCLIRHRTDMRTAAKNALASPRTAVPFASKLLPGGRKSLHDRPRDH